MGKDDKHASKGKKRKLLDPLLSDKRPQMFISEIETDPTKEYEIVTLVSPKESTDLNNDSSIVFEITTLENEYIRFNTDYQVRMDISLINQEWSDDWTAKEEIRLYTKTDGNICRYPLSTSGLNLFKNISVTYNNHLKDESVTFPQDGCFLNHMAAQDLFMSSEEYHKRQKLYNNHRISNRFLVDALGGEFTDMVNIKIHDNYTDAPVIPGVEGNDNGGSENGKIHYFALARPPFRAVNNYMNYRYGFSQEIVFPPYSTIRIVFYKNELEFKYLAENVEADDLAQINNLNFANDAFTHREITPYIHSMQLAIIKSKINPAKSKIPDRHFHNIGINHFDLFELSNATSQRINVNWRSQETPVFIVVSFMRQQDIIFNKPMNLPQAVNKFYLPRNLKSLSVRQPDFASDIFDGIKIEELDTNSFHSSKESYFQYLKLHGFIARDMKYSDVFCVDNGIGTGFTNIFPINIVGRQTTSKPHQEGLDIELQFTLSLRTKWFMCVRYYFMSYFNFQKMSNQKEYKITTNYL